MELRYRSRPATAVGPHTVRYTSGAGAKPVVLTLSNAAGSDTKSAAIQADSCSSAQAPYGRSPALIPGRVEAEKYDLDGEGIACHDSSTVTQGEASASTMLTYSLPPTATSTSVGYMI